jgi:hypothetical protein
MTKDLNTPKKKERKNKKGSNLSEHAYMAGEIGVPVQKRYACSIRD